MRRKSSAAVDQLDPRELIARVTAEHSSPPVHTGRHRASSPDPDLGIGLPADDQEPATESAYDLPVPRDPFLPDTEHRSVAAGQHEPAAEHPVDETAADEPGAIPDSLVEVDREATDRRTTVRRLAPLGIGAAAVLTATLIFTSLQPGSQDPDLNAALVNDASRRASSDTNQIASGPADGQAGARTLAEVAQGASDQIGSAVAAQQVAAAERRRAAQQEAAGPRDSAPAAGPVAGAAQVAGQGVQAALKLGWNAIGGDEFAGAALGSQWNAYDGPGHDGQGRRTPNAVSVRDGNLVISGDSEGNTGGISWGHGQQYGKWEVRAKFPKGDSQYHPVLILWPDSDNWPEGGEIDFAETDSGADDVSFFLHYGSSNSQKNEKKSLDITQWHNYAVSWTPEGITGYIDGVQWFRSTDSQTQPPGPMHPTIQLDYFPGGGSPQPSEMQVAWMRQYR